MAICACGHNQKYCPWCDEELPHVPTPNGDNASCMVEKHRLPPPIIHDQKEPAKYMENKPTFRVYAKAKTDFSLTIRDGKVILAPSNPSDPLQHWFKEEKFGMNVKDEEDFSSFSLVNKATGQALKYSIGVTYAVQLKKYNPDEFDVTVLWTNGHSFGDGYQQVRPAHNMHLKLDACKGIEEFGGVHDGTEIILWEWNNGDNQKWTIFP